MTLKKIIILSLAAVVAAGLLPITDPAFAKAPECEKNGVEYCKVKGNFRHEWWDYQERGLSCMEGECNQPALDDFQQCIDLRTPLDRAAVVPGCDKRRARTYGMHFEDYFCHREKGVALYHLGRHDEAIEELEFSLRCTDSAKAEYYLNQARSDKLTKSGADTQAPLLKQAIVLSEMPRIDMLMSSESAPSGYSNQVQVKKYFTSSDIEEIKAGLPKDLKKNKQYVKSLKPGWGKIVYSWQDDKQAQNNTTNHADVFVLIHSTDNYGISEVKLGQTISHDTFARPERVDVLALSLDPGRNDIDLTLTDIAGLNMNRSLPVYLDREGPRISIEDIKPGSSPNTAIVSGFVYDMVGIKGLTMNGTQAAPAGKDGFKVTVKLDDLKQISFNAVDKIGNTTTGVIHLEKKSKGAFMEHPTKWAMNNWFQPTRFADNSDTMFDFPTCSTPMYLPSSLRSERSFMRDVLLAEDDGNDVWWGSLLEAYDEYMDEDPPEITFKDFKVRNGQARSKVYFRRIYLEGNVSDLSAVKSLTINGTPLTKGERKNIFFNKIIKLRPGRNTIKLAATDINDNISEVSLFVDRVVPKVHQVGNRMFVSMLPFYQGERNKDIGHQADNLLTDALVNQQRFNFVDRSRMDDIIREQRFVAEKLTDAETSKGIKLGKLAGSENTILGLVVETPSSIEVTAQVIDNESSKILYEADAFHEDKGLSNLKFLMSGLAIKLRNGFPVLEGKIEASDKAGVYSINMGKRQMIKPGLRVLIFREEELIDPDTGKSVGSETLLQGQARVVAAYNKMSRIEIEKGKTQGDISVNDLVITK